MTRSIAASFGQALYVLLHPLHVFLEPVCSFAVPLDARAPLAPRDAACLALVIVVDGSGALERVVGRWMGSGRAGLDAVWS